MDGSKHREKATNKPLVIVLVVLAILIIGLVVGIVISKVVEQNSQGNVGSGCESIEDEYEMRVCLSNEEPSEELGDRYDAMLQKAFDDENYELFNDLIMDRSTDLALSDDCDTSIRWLDQIETKYANSLPLLDLYGLYINGVETSLECENQEKLTYYQSKADAIMNSEEYDAAVAGDDYRFPDENELDDEIEDDEDEWSEYE